MCVPVSYSQELSSPIPIEETIYNALNLSDFQIKCLKEFMCQNISEKEFKNILTRQQRSKYLTIKKIMKREAKKSKHPKNYYTKNPQMQRFGDECMLCPKNAVNK